MSQVSASIQNAIEKISIGEIDDTTKSIIEFNISLVVQSDHMLQLTSSLFECIDSNCNSSNNAFYLLKILLKMVASLNNTNINNYIEEAVSNNISRLLQLQYYKNEQFIALLASIIDCCPHVLPAKVSFAEIIQICKINASFDIVPLINSYIDCCHIDIDQNVCMLIDSCFINPIFHVRDILRIGHALATALQNLIDLKKHITCNKIFDNITLALYKMAESDYVDVIEIYSRIAICVTSFDQFRTKIKLEDVISVFKTDMEMPNTEELFVTLSKNKCFIGDNSAFLIIRETRNNRISFRTCIIMLTQNGIGNETLSISFFFNLIMLACSGEHNVVYEFIKSTASKLSDINLKMLRASNIMELLQHYWLYNFQNVFTVDISESSMTSLDLDLLQLKDVTLPNFNTEEYNHFFNELVQILKTKITNNASSNVIQPPINYTRLYLADSERYYDGSAFTKGSSLLKHFNLGKLFFLWIDIQYLKVGNIIPLSYIFSEFSDTVILNSNRDSNPFEYLIKIFTFLCRVVFEAPHNDSNNQNTIEILALIDEYIKQHQMEIYFGLDFLYYITFDSCYPYSIRHSIFTLKSLDYSQFLADHGIITTRNDFLIIDSNIEQQMDLQYINDLISMDKYIISNSKHDDCYYSISKAFINECLLIMDDKSIIKKTSDELTVYSMGRYIASLIKLGHPSYIWIDDISSDSPQNKSFQLGFETLINMEDVKALFRIEEVSYVLSGCIKEQSIFAGGKTVTSLNFSSEILSSKTWINNIEAITDLQCMAACSGFRIFRKKAITASSIKLQCSQKSCPFFINIYNSINNGTHVTKFNIEHNHLMDPHINEEGKLSPAEVQAIYEHYKVVHNIGAVSDFIKKSFNKRLSDQSIRNIIFRHNRMQGDSVNQVINEFQKMFDNHGYIEQYIVNHNVTALFLISPKEMENLNEFGDLIFIDPTFSRLYGNWRIIPITLIGKNRELKPGGIVLSENLKKMTFVFILNVLKNNLPSGSKFVTLATDDDIGVQGAFNYMEKNIENNHSFINILSIRRILCTWHKRTQLLNSLSSIHLSNDTIEETKILFNKLIYTRSKQLFDTYYTSLKGMHPIISRFLDLNKQDMNFMARVLIGDTLTLGYTSTGAAESHNHLIKVNIPHGVLGLNELYNNIMSQHERLQKNQEMRFRHNETTKVTYSSPNGEIDITDKCSVSVIIAQEIKKSIDNSHNMTTIDNGNGTFTVIDPTLQHSKNIEFLVEHNDSACNCQCKKYEQEGIICDHIFAVRLFIKAPNIFLPFTVLGRWCYHSQEKSSTKTPELPLPLPENDKIVSEPFEIPISDKPDLRQLQKKLFKSGHDWIKNPIVYKTLIQVFNFADAVTFSKTSKCSCLICGCAEHDLERCPYYTEFRIYIESLPSIQDDGKRKCSICGCTGHNAKTCQVLSDFQVRHPAVIMSLYTNAIKSNNGMTNELHDISSNNIDKSQQTGYNIIEPSDGDHVPQNHPQLQTLSEFSSSSDDDFKLIETSESTYDYKHLVECDDYHPETVYIWWGYNCYCFAFFEIIRSSKAFLGILHPLSSQRKNYKANLFYQALVNDQNDTNKKSCEDILRCPLCKICYSKQADPSDPLLPKGVQITSFIKSLFIEIFGQNHSSFHISFDTVIHCINCNYEKHATSQTYVFNASYYSINEEQSLEEYLFKQENAGPCPNKCGGHLSIRYEFLDVPEVLLIVEVNNIAFNEILEINDQTYELIGIVMEKLPVGSNIIGYSSHYIAIVIHQNSGNKCYWTIDSIGPKVSVFYSLKDSLKSAKGFRPAILIYEHK